MEKLMRGVRFFGDGSSPISFSFLETGVFSPLSSLLFLTLSGANA